MGIDARTSRLPFPVASSSVTDHLQAEKKCIQIYQAVRDSIPWDITCVRSKHAISIHGTPLRIHFGDLNLKLLAGQYPYRSIQIVLRLYSSPAEILAGFDVDCACVAYDGTFFL